MGIIPAHAGLTRRISSGTRWPRDHPRACGAHLGVCISRTFERGSSPRMRGSLVRMVSSLTKEGIIPAHAGLTSNLQVRELHWRDHPRACGAHVCYADYEDMQKGSSPRMRGSHGMKIYEGSEFGIIPAHAGLTRCHSPCCRRPRDHPRACGAHLSRGNQGERWMGSSPRMRGSHLFQHLSRAEAGIIPAHAGLTTIAGMAK